jgi:uncharacterized protein YecE (DUF72 family)
MSREHRPAIHVGCAGWAIPAGVADRFPAGRSALERYARRFRAAELNSTFHRAHRASTYARWFAATGPSFRFAVKVSKEITHERRLEDAVGPLERVLAETAVLGAKRGPLLVQLPPSLPFDSAIVPAFFDGLRARFDGAVACEPRHASWFAADVDALLARYDVARVAADPARVPQAASPGGSPSLVYYRLHGSPVTYRSPYSAAYLAERAVELRAAAASGSEVWCIFDNTASGAAAGDALQLVELLR